jgi:hypothetical protein
MAETKSAREIAEEVFDEVIDPAKRAQILIAALQVEATNRIANGLEGVRHAVNEIFMDDSQAYSAGRGFHIGTPAYIKLLGKEVGGAVGNEISNANEALVGELGERLLEARRTQPSVKEVA